MYACGECGEPNPGRARFCLGCGQPLARVDDEVRKVVTILFADVVGSTSLGERHDAEAYRRVLSRYFERMDDIVTRHGGTVEKYIGDAMMAVFGLPTVHEDDALRAVRAASEIRDEVVRLAAERPGLALQWRIGVNTGEVLVGGAGGRTLATGDAVNVAARLEQAAGAGEVLIGPATHAMTRDAVTAEELPELPIRGRSEPVVAYRLQAVDPSALGRVRRFDLPFVGRADELELIAWVVRRSAQGPTGQLLTVYGTVGVGKTRLVATGLADVGVPTLWGRCLPYGEGVTFWPLTEALTAATDLPVVDTDPDEVLRRLGELADGRAAPQDVAAVAVMAGLLAAPPADDAAEALRRYLTAVAGERGLVVVIDDLHLAEPALLDVLERLARARDVPLVVVAVARPELLELRPSWASGVANAVAVTLEPLRADEAATLVDDRLDGPVDDRTLQRLTDVAGGNPLFVEELVAMLLEDGTLSRPAGGSWALADLDHPLSLPASIHAVLAARVDALDVAERAVLGRAAVCGQRFTVDAVRALGRDDAEHLDARLAALVDRELLRPDGDGFAFRHGFVRDTVYGSQPRRIRADLHERHAAWLDQRGSGPQVDEFVAYHLERALQERLALDPDDPALGQLVAHVADRLADAGSRALVRGDMPAAVRLLRHAVDRLSEGDGRRPGLLADLGRALGEVGDFAAANTTLASAVAAATAAGEPRLRAHALITQMWVRSNLDLDGWVDAAHTAADEAEEVFAGAGDQAGLGRAWGLRAEVAYLRARYDESIAAMRRAQAFARDAGDTVEERETSLAIAFTLLPGPRPVAEVEAVCQELLARYPDEPSVEARLQQVRAGLAAMRGDTDRARLALRDAVDRFTELGQAYWLAVSAVTEGNVEAMAGDRRAAHAAWRRGLDALEAMGDRAQAAVVAATLSASVAADDPDEAAQLIASARISAAPDDLEAQVRLRIAEARLAAALGRPDDAVAAARAAARAAEASDGAVLRADADLALAELLVAAGRHADAMQAAVRAGRRYADKGHTVGVERADRVLGVSSSPAPAGDPA